jgi:hypothetical protein
VILAVLSWPVSSVGAQEVAFTPRKGEDLDRRLAEFIDGETWDLWTRDTVVSRDEQVRGDLLILESVARIAGEIEGDIYVVDGDLFLRPGARIHGEILVLGGGYFGSGMATVDGEVSWNPAERFVVLPAAGGLEIHPVVELPDVVDLHGLYGFEVPTYQRVDAVTLGWGVTLRAPTWAWKPSLELVARYRTGQGAFEGTVRQYWHPGPVEFGFEAERVTRTSEGWIRGDVTNSLSYLFTGDDFRNYYTSDRAAFVIRGGGEGAWTPGLRIEWDDASSRRVGDHFTLFGSDEVRPNPPVDDGEIWSAALEVSLDRETGERGRLVGRVRLEGADSTVAGDFSYVLGDVQARWRTAGFGSHEVDLFVLGRGDLAGDLPSQRWTGFGGRATLPTFGVMSFRGSRVVYGQLGYTIPIEPLRAGGLGAPGVFFRAGTGAAWGPDESAHFRANLMAGLRFWVLEGALAVDPEADDGDLTAYAIFRFPGDL